MEVDYIWSLYRQAGILGPAQRVLLQFKSGSIWKARVEGKHKFFTWLLVQAKKLMVGRLKVGINLTCAIKSQWESQDSSWVFPTYKRRIWNNLQDYWPRHSSLRTPLTMLLTICYTAPIVDSSFLESLLKIVY